jgi:DNA polymerase
MLKPMGFAQRDVYLTSVLKTMPPEDQRPHNEDTDLCGIWLQRQIELVNPSAIVALGGLAANFLLGNGADISLLRGKWGSFSSSNRPIPVMPTYHPTFVLEQYTQEVRGEVWSDLQQVMEKLKEVSAQI